MNNLWWQTIGKERQHLVLLHGWGLNAEVWRCIQKKLTSQFTLHLVDLPGFGRSQNYGVLPLDKIAKCVLKHAPEKAIWLGWSFGGLVASQAALINPERVQILVTVASSPCFEERSKWPGIKPGFLDEFQQKLSNNFNYTIEYFLALQTMGSKSTKQDVRLLKKIILAQPLPSLEVLNSSLEIIKITDLRERLITLQIPHLRLYGYLDYLVPQDIASLLDRLWPDSKSIVLAGATHVPFISHPSEFCSSLISLKQYFN